MEGLNVSVNTISRGRTGRPPLGRWQRVIIRVPADVHRALRARADARGLSVNEVVNRRLRGVVGKTKTLSFALNLADDANDRANVKPPQEELNNAESITRPD